MSAARIQGKEYPLKDIFCKNFEFIIPRYQRPYAWGLEQAQTLLEDLLEALGDLDDDTDDIESYFLGSIVLVKEEYFPTSEVVDGQQRLTTLTLLLAAVRSLYKNPHWVNKYIYEEADVIEGRDEHFHLTLRARDADFFREYIQRDEALQKLLKLNYAELTDSQKHIVTNTRKFVELLRSLSQNQLLKLIKYIANQCYLIAVSTPNIESAYRIFSILNDRGLDLSHADIFKAEVIGKIDPSEQDVYTKKWEDAEERVGRDGFKEVFAHIRMIHMMTRLRETILKEVRTHVLPQYSPQDFIDKVIVPYTEAYDIITTRSYQSTAQSEEVNRLFEWLGRIDNYDWLPPAMVFFNRCRHDVQALIHFYTDLERLAASMEIRRENVNLRQVRYAQLISAIEKGADLYAVDSPLQLTEKEKADTLNRLEGDIYNNGARGYILRRLDAELNENKTTPELPIITIEHVLPQNPALNSKWLEWYPDQEARAILVHRLGNLALLSKRKNSQAQNYEFDIKKNLYFNTPMTPFVLTTQIIKQNEWTQEVFEQRQKESVGILKKLWRLE